MHLDYDARTSVMECEFANKVIFRTTSDDASYKDAEYVLFYTPDGCISVGPREQIGFDSTESTSIQSITCTDNEYKHDNG